MTRRMKRTTARSDLVRLAVLALSVFSNGCSMLFMDKPPPGNGLVPRGDCTRSLVAPMLDGTFIMSAPFMAWNATEEDGFSAYRTELRAASVLVAGLTGYSALRGIGWSRECKRRNALGEQLMRDRLQAKAALIVEQRQAPMGGQRDPGYAESDPTASPRGTDAIHPFERRSLIAGGYRLQAAASGIPRLKSRSRPRCGGAKAVGASGLGGFRTMPRTWPLAGSKRMAVGASVSLSSVAEPPGPESVMLSNWSAQPDSAGSTNAKEERPPPSANSGMAKSSVKSSLPLAARPVMRCSP